MKKRVLALFIVSIMAFSIAGCSSGGETTSQTTDTTQETTETTAMTEEEYISKVTEINESIASESLAAMSGVDTSDMNALVDATKKMAEALKPYYEELAGLQAPEKFADAQEKIKVGAEASIEVLNTSIEMFDLVVNGEITDMDEMTAKTEELEAKLTEFQVKAADLEAGLSEVLEAAAE